MMNSQTQSETWMTESGNSFEVVLGFTQDGFITYSGGPCVDNVNTQGEGSLSEMLTRGRGGQDHVNVSKGTLRKET